MTDQTAPNVTDDDRRLARDWAESIEFATNSVESTTNPWSDRARAAARVILEAVPAPTPPTLADMTDEERAECRWMQCDYGGVTSDSQGRGVIGYFDYGEKKAVILTTTRGIVRRDYARVTPRPELPRMEWPGNKKADPAPALPDGWRLADHKDHGRVLVVRTDGENVIFGAPFKATGIRTHVGLVSDLAFVDTDTVPPSTLAVGSEWNDADALARACKESGRDQIIALDHAGDAYVWSEAAEWWEGSASPIFAPFTIIHAGKKADQ